MSFDVITDDVIIKRNIFDFKGHSVFGDIGNYAFHCIKQTQKFKYI